MTITIAPWDPGWSERYEALADEVRRRCGPRLVALEHIGSTAVPGLAAKPIIDLMGGVADEAHLDELVGPLVEAGWEYIARHEAVMPFRRFLCHPATRPREAHLHLVAVDHPFWPRHLAFRDWLREHPEDRDAYADLKRRLAALHGDDVPAYTEAKTEFISAVEARAQA